MIKCKKLAISTALLMIFQCNAYAQAGYAEAMEKYLEKFDYKSAYNYAQANKTLQDPEYDLWAGIAAQGLDLLNESKERLTRFINSNPKHTQLPRAYLELGYTLLLMGDINQAYIYLSKVLELNPPKSVGDNVDILRTMAANYSPWQFSGHLEGGLGYDSNANSGVSSTNLFLPIFGQVTMSPSSLETSAYLSHFAISGSASYRVNTHWSALAVGGVDSKFYKDQSSLNQSTPQMGVGATGQHNNFNWRMLQTAQQLHLGGDHHRDQHTTSFELSRSYDDQKKWTIMGSTGAIRHQRDQVYRDVDIDSYAVDFSYGFKSQGKPVLLAGFSQSKEVSAVQRPEFGRRINGAKLILTFEPYKNWYSGAQLTGQSVKHEAQDPLFLLARADDYQSLGLFAGRKFGNHRSVQLDYVRSQNKSNIEVWTYEKNTVSLKLRTAF